MEEKFVQDLIKLVATIRDKKRAKDFIFGLLTPGEIEDVSQRLQIFIHLLLGKSQRAVSKELKVSMGTISRASRELKYGSGKTKELIESFVELD